MHIYFWAIWVNYINFCGVTVAESKEHAIQNALQWAHNTELTVLPTHPEYDDFWNYGRVRYELLKYHLERGITEVEPTVNNTVGNVYSD